MTYEVRLKPSAERELSKFIPTVRKVLSEEIFKLKENPRPSGVKKLRGTTDLYRIRIGNFRIVYQIMDKVLVVTVVKVANRKEVY